MFELIENIKSLIENTQFWVEAYRDHTIFLFLALALLAALLERFLKKTLFVDYDDLVLYLTFMTIGLMFIFLGVIVPRGSSISNASVSLFVIGASFIFTAAVSWLIQFFVGKRKRDKAK